MEKKESQGLTVKKEEDIAEWYTQVCQKAELADYAPTKGCMIIRPDGYNIWQTIQDYFNENIVKPTGAKNAYFPIFIPESFFKKEAQHAKGFSPEVAWIDKELTKDGERLAIRPTSETIMYDAYSKWVRSHRDLPLKLNQWCNVVRWETEATKLFIRSREFLWQEGHCVYETEEECKEDTINYIKLYEKLCSDLLALPVLLGRKTDKEKFAGAKTSYSIEGFMPDGKALQCGTAHDLGQGFSKAFDIKFLGKDEKIHIPWQNSWGLSTRLLGALVMTHSDNKGLVLPPKVAYHKVVIIPIIIGNDKDKIIKKAEEIKELLKDHNPILDDREIYSPGWKFNEWELKGIPIRIEIGPKDIEKDQLVLVRRDLNTKKIVKQLHAKKEIEALLDTIQGSLFTKAKKLLNDNIIEVKTWKEFEQAIKDKKIAKAHFCSDLDCEDNIKAKLEGTKCLNIPFEQEDKLQNCVHCGKKAKVIGYFARSY